MLPVSWEAELPGRRFQAEPGNEINAEAGKRSCPTRAIEVPKQESTLLSPVGIPLKN